MDLCANINLGGLLSLYPPRLRLDSSVSGVTYSQSIYSVFSSFQPLVDHSLENHVGQMCQLGPVILPCCVFSFLLPPVDLCPEQAIQLETLTHEKPRGEGGVSPSHIKSQTISNFFKKGEISCTSGPSCCRYRD